jgi:hypothetical protein
MIDKPRFMADFLRIVAKSDRGDGSLIIPLIPNKVQLIYLNNKSPRNVILKARQEGTSTIILADFFIDTITIQGISSVVVSHGDKPTRRLFSKVHLFHKGCPRKNFFPNALHDAENLLTFPVLNSSFHVETAKSRIIGRGDTIHRCLLSEFPMYDIGQPGRCEEIFSEIGQSVPMKQGVLTVESTPYMKNDEFYKLYFGAKEGDNNFTPFFFPWWLADDYFITPEDVDEKHKEDIDLKLDSDPRYPNEEFLVKEKGLSLDQIRWRRYKIRELGHRFWREYPEDDQSCWLNPESMVFDKTAIERLMVIRQAPLEQRPSDFLTIWERPTGNETYVIGADVAEGLPQGDFSAARILKASNGSFVGSIRGKMPIDIFAGILFRVGIEYNTALLAVENSPHGIGVLTLLQNMGYPNLFWTMDEAGRPIKPGWVTSHTSRPLMIDHFDLGLRSGLIRDPDENALLEYQDFVYINGKPEVPKGSHSDLLFASMIAWEIRDYASPVTVSVKAGRYGIFD